MLRAGSRLTTRDTRLTSTSAIAATSRSVGGRGAPSRPVRDASPVPSGGPGEPARRPSPGHWSGSGPSVFDRQARTVRRTAATMSVHAGDECLLEGRRGRDAGVGDTDPLDRGVQVPEGLVRDAGRDLGPEAPGHVGLVRDHEASRALQAGDHRGGVERRDPARVDDVGLHALGGELGRGLERDGEHGPERDDRGVIARPHRARAAHRLDRRAEGDLAGQRVVEGAMLDHDGGIVARDRCQAAARTPVPGRLASRRAVPERARRTPPGSGSAVRTSPAGCPAGVRTVSGAWSLPPDT